MNQPHEVSVTTKNTVSLTLGIISVVLAVLALLFGWVPFLGLLAIPVAVLAGALAAIGVLIALFKGFRGAALPILGGVLSGIALVIPLLSTGGTTVAIANETERIGLEVKRIEEERRVEEENYITEHVELYDVSASKMQSALEGEMPGVQFKLRNKGTRALDRVEVTVFFKGSQNDIIAEETFTPISTSSFSLDDSGPLKPGYVWQMEKGKFYSAKSVPSEWEIGNVEAKITDISFSEDTAGSEASRSGTESGGVSPESKYIASFLELYEIDAKYMDSLLNGRVPGVLFKVRNKGDRTLSRVEVTVFFKDAQGKVIAEDSYAPVSVSSFSLGDNKPLKPGYVWQMENGKFYSAKSVPSEWKEGSVSALITGIEFQE